MIFNFFNIGWIGVDRGWIVGYRYQAAVIEGWIGK